MVNTLDEAPGSGSLKGSETLARMRSATEVFYKSAVQIGCHPFVEFAGLMSEYIQACQRAHQNGVDFTQCNAHSGQPLPLEAFEIAYINEKLECIFTGRSIIQPQNTPTEN